MTYSCRGLYSIIRIIKGNHENRQIGILSVLLQKETVIGPYLAEKFEVARRTINRDIEDLCKEGILLEKNSE